MEKFAHFVTWFFPTFWQYFTSWNIPGTDISPALWAIFALFFVLVLRFIRNLFSVDSSGKGNGKE